MSLQDEISYIEAYLALEQVRLGKRLQVNWSIQVKDALDSPVPTLILQPVVENAVLHGIAQKPEGGCVHITVDQPGSLLPKKSILSTSALAPTQIAASRFPMS